MKYVYIESMLMYNSLSFLNVSAVYQWYLMPFALRKIRDPKILASVFSSGQAILYSGAASETLMVPFNSNFLFFFLNNAHVTENDNKNKKKLS